MHYFFEQELHRVGSVNHITGDAVLAEGNANDDLEEFKVHEGVAVVRVIVSQLPRHFLQNGLPACGPQ